jgi:hypothetical protein
MMKNGNIYDVVIVGAGPAGLSAARTAARLGFSTVVLERLGGVGELSHPCSAIMAPIPRLALGGGSGPDSGRAASNLYFRKIDLSIPSVLVRGYPTEQHWLSPSGQAFAANLAGRKSGGSSSKRHSVAAESDSGAQDCSADIDRTHSSCR